MNVSIQTRCILCAGDTAQPRVVIPTEGPYRAEASVEMAGAR